jgi:hypothetical protein
LPCAEKHHRRGCSTREAWGRASAEWPELVSGRMLVSLFLIWKTSQGNLERRFRRVRETATVQRAALLDVSLENCMLVMEHTPSSQTLRALQTSISEGRTTAKKNFFSQILNLHEQLHGPKKQSTAGPRAERRDAEVRRTRVSDRPGPETEAAFGRKREAAVSAVVAATPSKRAHMLSHAPLGLAQVAQEVAAFCGVRMRRQRREPSERRRWYSRARSRWRVGMRRTSHRPAGQALCLCVSGMRRHDARPSNCNSN